MRFIPNTAAIRAEMLRDLGKSRMEDLFASLPREVLLGRELDIPRGMAESEQLALFQALAARNEGASLSAFLGGGSYPHYSPLVVDSLIQRAEFFTSYTPYQPEVSQGTLQSIFEFQTFITALTGMEAANASVYDGASATAEAVLMAHRLSRGRDRVLLAGSLHPHYRAVTETYTQYLGLPLETVPMQDESGQLDLGALGKALQDDVCCVVVQQPNFFGTVEDLETLASAAHEAGALLVVAVNEALSLAALQAPGTQGADLVVGEAQSFGIPTAFGGPYLGFMTAKEEHKRQLPGRIVGQTQDLEGRRGFVLTMATREQHIRREKATSNICTNQNLLMMVALMYLTLMGRQGLQQVAQDNLSLAAYAREKLGALPGYALRFSEPSFNEFTLTCPRPAAGIVEECLAKDVLPGIELSRYFPGMKHELLVAVTETKTKAELDRLITVLREVGA